MWGTGGQERTINEREKETATATSSFLAASHVVSAHPLQKTVKSQFHVGNSEEGGQMFQQMLAPGNSKHGNTTLSNPLVRNTAKKSAETGARTQHSVCLQKLNSSAVYILMGSTTFVSLAQKFPIAPGRSY